MSTWIPLGSVGGRRNWKAMVVSASGPTSARAESTAVVAPPPAARATKPTPCTRPPASRARTCTGDVLPAIRISFITGATTSTSRSTGSSRSGAVGRGTSAHAANEHESTRNNGARTRIGAPGSSRLRSRSVLAPLRARAPSRPASPPQERRGGEGGSIARRGLHRRQPRLDRVPQRLDEDHIGAACLRERPQLLLRHPPRLQDLPLPRFPRGRIIERPRGAAQLHVG